MHSRFGGTAGEERGGVDVARSAGLDTPPADAEDSARVEVVSGNDGVGGRFGGEDHFHGVVRKNSAHARERDVGDARGEALP